MASFRSSPGRLWDHSEHIWIFKGKNLILVSRRAPICSDFFSFVLLSGLHPLIQDQLAEADFPHSRPFLQLFWETFGHSCTSQESPVCPGSYWGPPTVRTGPEYPPRELFRGGKGAAVLLRPPMSLSPSLRELGYWPGVHHSLGTSELLPAVGTINHVDQLDSFLRWTRNTANSMFSASPRNLGAVFPGGERWRPVWERARPDIPHRPSWYVWVGRVRPTSPADPLRHQVVMGWQLRPASRGHPSRWGLYTLHRCDTFCP